ncbi:MAG TPA: hypothetical protein VIF12_00285 [Micavibrio sp.]|jgi:hypothetical protein
MTTIRLSSALRILILSAPLALAACTSEGLHMPKGYTYQNEIYKAPPGPEASPPAKILQTTGGLYSGTDGSGAGADMGEDGTTPDGMHVVQTETIAMTAGPDGTFDNQTLCTAADDLVGRLLRNFGRPMEPVLVPDSSPLTSCLRNALQRGNVPLAPKPGDGPFVLDHAVKGANAEITFMSNHDPVTSESGAYPGAAPLTPIQ